MNRPDIELTKGGWFWKCPQCPKSIISKMKLAVAMGSASHIRMHRRKEIEQR